MSPLKLFASTLALSLASLGTPASAQDMGAVSVDDAAPEISRDAIDLRAVLVPRPDLDTVDTALVFTNPRNAPTWVVCAGHNANGKPVGRARTRVPAHGVRLIFASDLSNGGDYIGSAVCKARSRVVPSAFIIGAELSDAPARTSHGWSESTVNFPIVATF